MFRTVGRFYPNIFLAILTNDHQQQAFFPFMRDEKLNLAKPVPLCDYQAIIGPDYNWNIQKILKAFHLNAWDFNHLVNFNTFEHSNNTSEFTYNNSPYIDLSTGLEQYLDFLKSKNINFEKQEYYKRLIERDVGLPRFVISDNNSTILSTILTWKFSKYNRGKAFSENLLQALEHLFKEKDTQFSGVISALYAGENLIAAHFGLRCHGILYYWFPAYDLRFSKYSPGYLLLHYLLLHLNDLNCQILDFGPGGEEYKWKLFNASRNIAKGSFEVPSPLTTYRQSQRWLRKKVLSHKWLKSLLNPITTIIRNTVNQQ